MESDRVERRLAAIPTAVVVGYSRFMEADEEGTLARLKSLREELFDPKITEHHGRIVKTTGDGVLVEFASAVDAVRCAAEVQGHLTERNSATSENQRLEDLAGLSALAERRSSRTRLHLEMGSDTPRGPFQAAMLS